MERSQFPSSREELEYEIEDLQSEIARHHRDFKRIREILDDHDRYSGLNFHSRSAQTSLRLIRNIVG